MYTQYHKEITTRALQKYFSEQVLSEIIRANLKQDLPQGQMGHPEYHFDDSEFIRTSTYLSALRQEVLDSLKIGRPNLAWAAFGKITHASQDFYAHSNYIRLWVDYYQKDDIPPGKNDILIPELENHPALISGTFYQPWEWITFIPFIGKYFAKLFPDDSHAKLNLDRPGTGKLFIYAYEAAVFRTEYEYNELIKDITKFGPNVITEFTGLK